ncbi:MAG: hypothetical protein PHQ66_01830 [Candidatus Nanoarchaeia archaeon]|nr:hypothetical protein [Candidatus Nanoarchaeia archaeon]MDD5357886.1 hypothetical protein [Candidatus Nanoarchaeia archaeon]MDD5588805.1 hypothetical protein [Candidatus Nanoarchaeia archaeon]
MKMKGVIIFLALVISLISFISAEMIFIEPLTASYNLGDSVFVPVTIKVVNEVSGIFAMDLICNNTEIRFYTTGVKLSQGEEITLVDPNLVLIRGIIGNNKGECKIKAVLGSEYVLTNSFRISDKLLVSGTLERTEFDAGEGVLVTGKVTKETGEISNGFIEAAVLTGDSNSTLQTTQIGTVSDGKFSLNLSLPAGLKAQDYLIEIKAYEKDSEGIITNNGAAQYSIHVKQVPTNLELILENEEIMPGTSVKINSILHDQTGEPINSTAVLTIGDSEGTIVEQKDIVVGELFEFPIKSDQPPAEWIIQAESNGLIAEEKFRIKENMEIDIQVINKTVVVTNIGNVFYNKTVLVQVGDSPLNIQVELPVGESKKYVVKAPNGDYNVRISEGDKEVSEMMSLTGKTVGIEEASIFSGVNVFWFFLILILGLIAFMYFTKLYKKPFFGRMVQSSKSLFRKLFHRREKREKFKSMAVGDDFKMIPKMGNRAELSLSIKEGDKQEASIVGVRIKDLREIQSRRSRVSETIEKIIDTAEDKRAVVCENQDYLLFILAPARTRTPKNEKTALDLAEKIKSLLEEHNRMFNQKIDFGISLNYGAIIGKQEGDMFKFMSVGSLVTASKKIAHISEGEILLSDKINDLLRLYTRTEKKIRDGIPVFSIKEIKKETDDATKKFISKFMERQKRGD